MNRRKSKEIRRAAAKLVKEFPDNYKNRKLHVATKLYPQGAVKLYQYISGFRAAKRRAKESLCD
jgi:hypothetical protein